MGTRTSVEDEARRTYRWEVHPETAAEILARKAAAVALGAAARAYGLDGFLALAEADAVHEFRATSEQTKERIYVVRSDGWALGLEQTGGREVFLCGAVRAIMKASAEAEAPTEAWTWMPRYPGETEEEYAARIEQARRVVTPPDCAACGGEGTVQDDPEPGVHGPAVDCRDCGGAGVVTEGERDRLGRIVREVWIEWAREQPAPKPSWLVPWEGLAPRDREVDRRIGERLAREGARRQVWQPGDPEPPNGYPYHVHYPVPGPDPWAAACGRRVPRSRLVWPGRGDADCPGCLEAIGAKPESVPPEGRVIVPGYAHSIDATVGVVHEDPTR